MAIKVKWFKMRFWKLVAKGCKCIRKLGEKVNNDILTTYGTKWEIKATLKHLRLVVELLEYWTGELIVEKEAA